MDFKDPCNLFSIEAELNPGSIERWLSIVKDGKKSDDINRRSDLSTMVKKHLSALGWFFSYAHKGIGKKRELRYKSPNGKWFYSLATACMSCVDQHSQRQQQIIPKKDLSCPPRNLKKKNRIEDFDNPNGSASNQENPSSDLIKIIPEFDVSKQQQKKKKRKKKASEEIIIRPRRRKSVKKNCDVCCICHWGGELLLCDGCPSAFHHTCLGFSTLPEEDIWFCPCCSCDVCGSMESPENSKLMICEQCQRRFHLSCLKEEPLVIPSIGWFCSSQCNRVYSGLQNLLGCKIVVGKDSDDLVWTLMRAPNEDEHYDDEQISKLDSAVEILHQGFEPTTDRFSGRDLVEELIYRRDRTGVGRGFYTVLIEKKKEPITVAAVRVDKNVAEIPLVATLTNYRRNGMCRVLMDELEKQMSQMGVCRLVLPAAEVVVTTWTQRFGFSVMESSERLELVKHGMLDFVGTVMCHKFLVMKREEEKEEDSAQESSLTQ